MKSSLSGSSSEEVVSKITSGLHGNSDPARAPNIFKVSPISFNDGCCFEGMTDIIDLLNLKQKNNK